MQGCLKVEGTTYPLRYGAVFRIKELAVIARAAADGDGDDNNTGHRDADK